MAGDKVETEYNGIEFVVGSYYGKQRVATCLTELGVTIIDDDTKVPKPESIVVNYRFSEPVSEEKSGVVGKELRRAIPSLKGLKFKVLDAPSE